MWEVLEPLAKLVILLKELIDNWLVPLVKVKPVKPISKFVVPVLLTVKLNELKVVSVPLV